MKVLLGGKEYEQDYVRAIALREIDGPMAILEKVREAPEALLPKEDMDCLAKWFCLFFGSQFTTEEFWNGYPADRVKADIFEAVMYCQAGVTRILHDFPTMAEAIPQTAEEREK